MSDHVEIHKRGFFGRISNSFGGALFGLLLLVIGVGLLFWNEGRAVKRYKDLKEGAGAVVSIDAGKVDAATEKKLVHLSGETATNAPLADTPFGVSAAGLKLIRDVEMYQWVEVVRSETKSKVGGGSETVKHYTYDKEWRKDRVDSDHFKVAAGHHNPQMEHSSFTHVAQDVVLGAFSLPTFLVSQIGGAEPFEVASLDEADEAVRSRAKLHDGGVYLGNSPELPAIGDLKVRFRLVPNGPVSIVAQQSGSSFVPYKTKTGGEVSLVESGTVDSAEMFQRAHHRNKVLTWAVRGGGFLALGLAFSLILGPIAAFSSFIPFLGRIAGTGITIVGFLLAGVVSLLTVGVAWIFYRPLLGIGLFIATAALLVMLVVYLRKRSSRPAPPVPAFPESPPPLT